jgi:RHS repeat-associated protein
MTSTGRSIVLLVLVAWSASSLLADCEPGTPPPQVTIEYLGPDETGDGTAKVTYSFPNMTSASKRQLELKIDGNIWTSFGTPQQSGVWEGDVNTTCWTNGSHTLEARATSLCNPPLTTPASTSVPVNTTPSVSIEYVQDAMGNGTISVPYNFPNTSSPSQRQLNLKLDGGGLATIGAPQVTGVWEYPFSVTCLSGAHELSVVAHACGNTGSAYSDTDTTSVGGNSKPSVSIEYSELNGGIASVTYDFPNTGQRLLQLYIDGGVAGSHQPSTTSGVWPVTVGTCWKKLRVVATSCGQGTNPQFTDEDELEHEETVQSIAVALLKVPGGNIQASVTWNNVIVNGTISVKLQNWTTAAGQVLAGGTLKNITATAASGKDVFTFPSPDGARLLSVIASAPTACGIVTDDASTPCDICEATANPVYWSDGNMRLFDGEPLPAIGGHGLARTYDSDEQAGGLFGRGWTTLFERRLIAHGDGAVSIVTGTNEVVTFRPVLGVFRQTWPRSVPVRGTLVHDPSAGTYTYRAPAATEVAIFRASDGRLVTLRDTANAREAVIAYDAQGRPSTFNDAVTGVSWNLTIDAQRRVTSIGVGGHPELTWSYSYDGNGNLLTVFAPGSAVWRTYEYSADRMTASRDVLGNLIESHTYDADGHATGSTGDVDEIAGIQYGLPGSVADERVTRVTYRTGAVAEYALRAVGSAWRSVRVSGGCASCGTHDATYVRDAQGRVIRHQAADGYITVTRYINGRVQTETRALKPSGCDPATDTQHCRLGTDDLATSVLEPTAATVQVVYEYADPLWPDRMTAMTRPSVGAPGQMRRASYGYHPVTGARTNATVCGWTAGDTECSERTTLTTFYEGGASGLTPAFDPGGAFQSGWLALAQPAYLTKSIDGPRTDLQDISSFVYYPIDAAVPALLRGRLAAMKSAAGHITRYESYDIFGNATRVVDPNGVAMERTFDALGRLITSTMKGVAGCNTADDPLCATDLTATRAYTTGAGPLRLEQRPGGGVTAYAYDTRGRVQTVSRGPAENDLRERIETTYDLLTGKKSLQRTLAYEVGTWVEKQRQSFAYDSHARLQTVTHADGAAVHYAYDPEDRVATVGDENHASANTTYAYDPAGRVATVTQTLAGASGGVITTHYEYDTDGNLTTVTDPNGNVTSYVYDDFGQLTSQESPVTGTTAYAYDSAGNLAQMTDANGATTSRVYDALSRVTTATSVLATKSEVVSWSYDNPTSGRFAIGRLASMTDPSGSTAYHYERRGLLRDETRTFTGAQYSYTTAFQYDADGNRAVVKYPSTQLTVTYGFDYAGRSTSASNLVAAATYLPFGPVKSLSFANGTTQTLGYDARYRVTSNSLAGANTTLAQYTYGYDASGNITSILDATDSGYDRTFQYDDLNRLITANTGAALWRHGGYTWDAMGNLLSLELGEIEKGPTDPLDALRDRRYRLRTQENLPLGRSSSFAYEGTTPRLLEVMTNDLSRPVGYDPGGNETSYVATRTYSPRNLLAEVTDPGEPGDPLQHKLTYTYDGRGIRVIRAESPADGPNTTARRFSIYTPELQLLAVTRDDASNVWAFSAADKNIHYEIVWFAGRPIAQVTPAGPRLYTFTDHLGTPILQTDAAATVTWRAEYEPFGNVWEMRTGKRTDQPLRFPGQEVAMNWEGQEENYNIFRWYRTGWGRYTTPDPLGLAPDANTFRYAASRPVVAADPLGLFCTKDFVLHYLGRSGTTVDLKKVGLLSTFISSPSVSGTIETELTANIATAKNHAKQACKGCPNGNLSGSFKSGGDDNYVNVYADNTPCLGWPIGSTILSVWSNCKWTANCSASTFQVTCKSNWKLRDRFTNPLSQGEPGGNPGNPNDLFGVAYDIVADWSINSFGGGSW